MSSTVVRASVIVVSTYVVSVSTALLGSAAPEAQGPGRSAKDGAYTSAQAQRGRAEYVKSCANCHRDDMAGSTEAPALVGEKFIQEWQDRSVGDLFDLIRKTMPYDQPESLTEQAYADIVATLLQRNNYPAGADELPSDSETLKSLTLKD